MPRMKAIDEANRIAAATLLRGYAYKQGKLYVIEGVDVWGSKQVITGTSLAKLRLWTKRMIEAWQAEEKRWGAYPAEPISRGPHTYWANWSAARKQVVDSNYGEGTYDWIMERVMK